MTEKKENMDAFYLGEPEDDIYRENILDHYRNPHNKGELKGFNFTDKENNPLCGDTIEAFIRVEDGKVKGISWKGSGCAISQASMSMLTDEIKGKSVEEIKKMTKDDIVKMLGIKLGIVRLKCALLGLKTISKALDVRMTR